MSEAAARVAICESESVSDLSKSVRDVSSHSDYGDVNAEGHDTAPIIQDCIALVVNDSVLSPDCWFVDTGCSDHMCFDALKFTHIRDVVGRTVKMGNGNRAIVRGIGEVEITLHVSYGGRTLRLSDILYVPELSGNSLSVGELTEKGVSVNFKGNEATARLNGLNVFVTERRGDVYIIGTVSTTYNPDFSRCKFEFQ